VRGPRLGPYGYRDGHPDRGPDRGGIHNYSNDSNSPRTAGFISCPSGDIVRSTGGRLGAAILLYLIAIDYSGGAIMAALNSNGAYADLARIAFSILVGGVFSVASFWATGRILAGSANFRASFKLGHLPDAAES
jgi:hypothetical protein